MTSSQRALDRHVKKSQKQRMKQHLKMLRITDSVTATPHAYENAEEEFYINQLETFKEKNQKEKNKEGLKKILEADHAQERSRAQTKENFN